MYVQRRPQMRPARRSNWQLIGCGCLGVLGAGALMAVLGVLVLLPRLPQLAASVAGLSARGETSAVFEAAAPLPPIQLENAVAPEQVTVSLGSYGGEQTVAGNSEVYDVAVGSDTSGRQTAVVTFTEDGLLEVCRQRSEICSGANPQYQNPRIDLRPGGAVIFADVTVPTEYGFTVQQTAGVVLQLDASRRQFEFAGIDLNGTLYDAPPNELAATIQEFERTGNDVLTQLSVNAGAGVMALSEVRIDDTTMSLVMQ